MNHEKEEVQKEKLNILKLEDEARVKSIRLNEQKEKIKFQANNIQNKLDRIGNPQLTYFNNDKDYNNTFNNNSMYSFNNVNKVKNFYYTSPESFPSNRNADNNTIITNENKAIEAEDRNTKTNYFENIMNNSKNNVNNNFNADNNE